MKLQKIGNATEQTPTLFLPFNEHTTEDFINSNTIITQIKCGRL